MTVVAEEFAAPGARGRRLYRRLRPLVGAAKRVLKGVR